MAGVTEKVYRGKNGFVSARFRGSLAEKVKALGKGAEDALRPAAQAGAQVFYDEMKQRAPVDDGLRSGAVPEATLRNSIYQFYLERKSTESRHVYVVGPNKSKAPHWHLVEFGHWQNYAVARMPDGMVKTLLNRPLIEPVFVPAYPYIRPTLDAKAVQALEAMRERFTQALRESNTGWQ